MPKFRSVLPHEPLPDGDVGYIHLQGAFEPKKKNSEDAFHWQSAASLERDLSDVLTHRYQALSLPHPVKSVEVLDPTNPPFTKVRLSYATPQQALKVQTSWRQHKISPAQLFSDAENNTASSFGSHTCQATMVTAVLLPADSTCCWTRSNPPKFRRLLHEHNDQEERSSTRFVFVTGLLQDPKSYSSFWAEPYAAMESMRKVWDSYDSSGLGVEIFLSKKQSVALSCHIGMRSATDCQRVISELQGKTVTWEHGDSSVCSGALFLDYASVTQRSLAKTKSRQSGEELEKGTPSRPECTSTTDSVDVPGLVVVEDYVTETQQRTLMAVLTGPQAPWAPDQANKSQSGAVKRSVQHYGYVFDYQTADVLRNRQAPGADCPPMPQVVNKEESMDQLVDQGRGWDVLAGVVEKTRQYEFEVPNADPKPTGKRAVAYPTLNQLTVNQYKPGEGIGSHVDTPSAFSDGLIIISLNGGIVMEFRKVGTNPLVKKLVYLPARSIALLSGPARYDWEHYIVTRRTDTHQGEVLPRKLRVSLTLRTAISEEGAPLPLVESAEFPPRWGESETTPPSLATPATERDHVHAVYDAIATQWHHTRGKRGVLWPGATQFLQRLPPGSIVADVGCGDGKYFPAIWEAGSYVIGTDISRPLLETAFNKDDQTGGKPAPTPETRRVSSHREFLRDYPAVAVADCMSVPLRDKSCDAAICIAVMHHLSTQERRKRCVEELVRIVRVGGMINIQAWALEQEQNSRRRFAAPDVFVPFNAQPKYLCSTEPANTSMQRDSPAEDAVPEGGSKSVAEAYSKAYTKADFDEQKGLVVFQRYCHLYRKGELEEIARSVPGSKLVESGYESGNHFVILEVTE